MNATTSPDRPRNVGFAIGAVFALLGVALVSAFYFADDEAASTQSIGTGGTTDPFVTLDGLSHPLPALDAAGRAGAAGGANSSANGSALGSASQRVADASADAAEPGADAVLSGRLDAATVLHRAGGGAFHVERVTGSVEGATGGDFAWYGMASPVNLSRGATVPQTGEEDVDAALGEAQGVLVQAEALLGSPEVQALYATAEENGVPVPGLVKSPFGADAEGTVEPDEEGAQQASGHAHVFLDTVGSGYGSLEGGLGGLETAVSGLDGDVQDAYTAADQHQLQAQQELDAELAARQQAVAQAAADYEARVHAAAGAHAEAALAARDGVIAQSEAEVAARQAAIDERLARARADLEARLADVETDAGGRLDAITALESDVQGQLDAGTLDAAGAEAFFAASAQARAAIQAHLEAQAQQVQDALADAQADAEATRADLDAQLESARLDAQAEAEAQVAWARAQEAELLAGLEDAVEDELAAQADHRAHAQARLEAYVADHKARLVTQAQDLIATARGEAEAAQDVVATVQGEAASEVGADLAYLQKVVEDYRGVPTPERQAAAQAWADVHGSIQGGLDSTLSAGEGVEAQAQAVLDAAAQAEAGLAAIA